MQYFPQASSLCIPIKQYLTAVFTASSGKKHVRQQPTLHTYNNSPQNSTNVLFRLRMQQVNKTRNVSITTEQHIDQHHITQHNSWYEVPLPPRQAHTTIETSCGETRRYFLCVPGFLKVERISGWHLHYFILLCFGRRHFVRWQGILATFSPLTSEKFVFWYSCTIWGRWRSGSYVNIDTVAIGGKRDDTTSTLSVETLPHRNTSTYTSRKVHKLSAYSPSSQFVASPLWSLIKILVLGQHTNTNYYIQQYDRSLWSPVVWISVSTLSRGYTIGESIILIKRGVTGGVAWIYNQHKDQSARWPIIGQ